MTDREIINEVVKDCQGHPEKIADRLIAAGFGMVKKGTTWDDVHDVMSDLEDRGLRESDA